MRDYFVLSNVLPRIVPEPIYQWVTQQQRMFTVYNLMLVSYQVKITLDLDSIVNSTYSHRHNSN
jgi:hypothetical protein